MSNMILRFLHSEQNVGTEKPNLNYEVNRISSNQQN